LAAARQCTAASQTAGLDLDHRPHLIEASAAVDRAIQARKERHQRRRSTLGARDLMKLPGGLTLTLTATVCAALMAALGLIQQSSLSEERLLTSCENERGRTISAGQRLVSEAHV